jgi:hypothetical protein
MSGVEVSFQFSAETAVNARTLATKAKKNKPNSLPFILFFVFFKKFNLSISDSN